MSTEKKEWPVTLRLTVKDMERLYIKAGEGGLTVEELLESFIRDLTFSDQSNGSDERYRAEAWYERCGFEMLAERGFLSYMLRYEDVKDAVSMWNGIQEEEARLAVGLSEFCDQEDMESAKEDVAYWREQLEGFYEDYKKCCTAKGRGLETEIRELAEWYGGLEKVNRGIMP